MAVDKMTEPNQSKMVLYTMVFSESSGKPVDKCRLSGVFTVSA